MLSINAVAQSLSLAVYGRKPCRIGVEVMINHAESVPPRIRREKKRLKRQARVNEWQQRLATDQETRVINQLP